MTNGGGGPHDHDPKTTVKRYKANDTARKEPKRPKNARSSRSASR